MTAAALFAPLAALFQVVLIDLVLAGDNAMVVGLAVVGLAPGQQRRAIVFGLAAAAGVRLVLAFLALRLLAIIGLLFAGGLLLLWVAWRLYRELRARAVAPEVRPGKTLWAAMLQIALADLSMSLDNVLAVAGAAQGHWVVLVLGLALGVLAMGLAASLIARLLHRLPWLSWLGLASVVFVALKMIVEGWVQIFGQF